MRFPRVVHAVFSLALLVAIGGGLIPGAMVQPALALNQEEQPAPGGVLHLALGEDPDQLDPARTIELTASDVMNVVYERLVYIGTDGLPHPWVAESWEISPDGKVITFKIRQGIKFHDGTDLDANAVKVSFDRILDPEMAAPYKTFVGSL
jgi:peptide/nickel transport system substrate-binding protein